MLSSLVKAAPVLIAVLSGLVAVGCASSTDETDDEVEVELSSDSASVSRLPPLGENCRRTFSEIVPVHIAYRDVHCTGWTGKVFCEYESLSAEYGPGWGTCQCYRDRCEKAGRSCRVAFRRGSC